MWTEVILQKSRDEQFLCNRNWVLGRFAILKKYWAGYEQFLWPFFHVFIGKKNCLKSIIATKKLYNIIFYKNLGQETFSIMSLSSRNSPPRGLCIMTLVWTVKKKWEDKKKETETKTLSWDLSSWQEGAVFEFPQRDTVYWHLYALLLLASWTAFIEFHEICFFIDICFNHFFSRNWQNGKCYIFV